MTLSAVRDGLVTRLNTISGLRVYEVGPAAVSEFPAAIISQEEPFIKYDQMMGGADVRYAFKVVLLVSSGDRQQAWADLEPYLAVSGASSLKLAVDGTLGGNADWARVVRVEKSGLISYNRAVYWGAALQVDVYGSG